MRVGQRGSRATAGAALPSDTVDFAPLDAAAALTCLKFEFEFDVCADTTQSLGGQHLAGTFRALAQLKTLRALHISAPLTKQAQLQLETSLRALRALTHLDIYAMGEQCTSDAGSLVDSLLTLPQLANLCLVNCFECTFGPTPIRLPQEDREAVLILSRLTRLTRLSLGQTFMADVWAGVFAEALGALSGLQELSVWGTTEFDSQSQYLRARQRADAESESGDSVSEGTSSGEFPGGCEAAAAASRAREAGFRGPLVLHVCRCTTLPALRSLKKKLQLQGASTFTARPADYVRCLDAGGGGVLQQLTALDPQRCRFSEADAGDVQALLCRLTSLQSVNLAGNSMRDSGLLAIAAALPKLTALKSLDVGGMNGTVAGVRRVLEAAEKLQEGGNGGLRRLALAHTQLCEYGDFSRTYDRAAPQLGRLVWLDELVLRWMGMVGKSLRTEGLRVLLQALPRLRMLDIQYVEVCESAVSLFAQATCLQRLEGVVIPIGRRESNGDRTDTVLSNSDLDTGRALKQAILVAAPWLTIDSDSTWVQRRVK